MEFLVSDVESGLAPSLPPGSPTSVTAEWARKPLETLELTGSLQKAKSSEELRYLEQSLALTLIHSSSISDVPTRESQLLKILKASAADTAETPLACLRDTESLQRTLGQARERGMQRAAAFLADHDHKVGMALELYLRLPKGENPHAALQYARKVAYSFRQLVCDPLAEETAPRRYSLAEARELRECIWTHLTQYLDLTTAEQRLEVVMVLLELLKPQPYVPPSSAATDPFRLPEPTPDDVCEAQDRQRTDVVNAFVQLYFHLIKHFPETALPLYRYLVDSDQSDQGQQIDEEWQIIRLAAIRQCFPQLVALSRTQRPQADSAEMLMRQALSLSVDLHACLQVIEGEPILELALLLGTKQHQVSIECLPAQSARTLSQHWKRQGRTQLPPCTSGSLRLETCRCRPKI